jgi:hypothetical protein
VINSSEYCRIRNPQTQHALCQTSGHLAILELLLLDLLARLPPSAICSFECSLEFFSEGQHGLTFLHRG